MLMPSGRRSSEPVPLPSASGRPPRSAAIVGGLIFSQVLTLYPTPVIYLAFDRLARRVTGRSANAGPTEAEEALAAEGS